VKLLSVNVGTPRAVAAARGTVLTAIWKTPVTGRVAVRRLNIDGDRQADLTVHGGERKAVYAYPSEHYPPWEVELGTGPLPWGAFGENLTVSGLLETVVRIGDRLGIGTAILEVTQPRLPCGKLALRCDRPDMPRLFLRSGRSGFYLSVVREGEIGAGDGIRHETGNVRAPSVADILDDARGGPAKEAS